jgi:hypothetical protein
LRVQTLLIVLVVLVLAAMYLTWLAGRLDRQHVRVEAGRSALDAALVRRAALSEELADHLTAPARSAQEPARSAQEPARSAQEPARSAQEPAASAGAVAAAARRARDADPDQRERAENDLTRVLRPMVTRAATSGQPVPGLVDQLAAATARIQLARTIYNNAVDHTLALRRRRLVRWLHLAGRAAAPTYFEIDDTWQDAGRTDEGGLASARREP